MVLKVTSGAIATLCDLAAREFPRECCGLLLGQGDWLIEVRPCANIHADPLTHFELDPTALIAAHRAARGGGPQLLGYYHSHPNGHPLPSATDCEHSSGDGAVWAIIAGGAVGWFRDAGGCFEELPTRLVDG